MKRYKNHVEANANAVRKVSVKVDETPPAKKFEDALRTVLSVPKSVVDARVREEKAQRKRKS